MGAFIKFWKEFSVKVHSLDSASVKKITLDSIWLWGEHVSSNDFTNRYYKGYSTSYLSTIILDTNKIHYGRIGCHPSPPVKDAVKDFDEYTNTFRDVCNCFEATIKDTVGPVVNTYQFTFLETTIGFKLFGVKSYNNNGLLLDRMIDTIEDNH